MPLPEPGHKGGDLLKIIDIQLLIAHWQNSTRVSQLGIGLKVGFGEDLQLMLMGRGSTRPCEVKVRMMGEGNRSELGDGSGCSHGE